MTLNRLIAERLDDDGRIRLRSGWYLGRPVMVTRNDYRQQLFNGDVGVVVQDDGRAGWAILFDEPSAPSSVRRVPAALVPDAKTCFAMTIHKSQGSEFHRVLVVLPERHTPLLSRELLYTAVTRVCDTVDPATGQRKAGDAAFAGDRGGAARDGGMPDATEQWIAGCDRGESCKEKDEGRRMKDEGGGMKDEGGGRRRDEG